MEIGLEMIRPGNEAVILQILDYCPIKKRLREFGFVPGTEIYCRFLSPGGHLAALELLGTVIAVRVGDLRGITVRRRL